MAGLPALAVRVITRAWRQIVVEADPELTTEDQNPVEYEFSNGRKLRGYYKNRGPYA